MTTEAPVLPPITADTKATVELDTNPEGAVATPAEAPLQFKYRLTAHPGNFSEETDDVESLLETARVWLLHGNDVNIVNLAGKS